MARGGELPEPGHDVDAGVELGLGQPDLAGELMQMADERLHDLPEPRVVGPARLSEHGLYELPLVLNDHVLLVVTAIQPGCRAHPLGYSARLPRRRSSVNMLDSGSIC